MSLELLEKRSLAFAKARAFFSAKNILEVDPPSLLSSPPLDAHIEVMEVEVSSKKTCYLHTSPEYAMKKILSKCARDIYFLGHVFRKGEKGKKHHPEFTMAEWYRIGVFLPEMIEETADFLSVLLPRKKIECITYQNAFQKWAEIDPFQASFDELSHKAQSIDPYLCLSDRDSLLDFLLTHLIEPHLGQNGNWTSLIDYPPSQAAYACLKEDEKGQKVASRFEIYIHGIEMANGYEELSCEKEIRQRLLQENARRTASQLSPYPLDEEFLSIFSHNTFPPCCGVSVGFDRLFMLAIGQADITQAIHY